MPEAFTHHQIMAKKKESEAALLAVVTWEMAKPRVTKSVPENGTHKRLASLIVHPTQIASSR